MGDIDIFLGGIQCHAGFKPALGQLRSAIEGLLGIGRICLRLLQGFTRHRQSEFLKLAHPHFRLVDDALGLRHRGGKLAGVELDQSLALADALPLVDLHLRHRAGDLAADRDPERGLHASGCHHSLDQRTTPHDVDDHGGAHDGASRLPRAKGGRDAGGKDEPMMQPQEMPRALRPCGLRGRGRCCVVQRDRIASF